MAATTKFPSILANKISQALIFAFLEWILIFFLLIHSIFSLFLLKFSLFFGLKPPCFLCSHLSPSSSSSSFHDIICEQHSLEISTLGYCPNHRKLVKSKQICHNCSPSPAPETSPEVTGDTLFRRVSEDGIGDDVKRCSCCFDVVMSEITKMPRETGELVVSDFDGESGFRVVGNDEEEKIDVGFEGEEKPLIDDDDDYDDGGQNGNLLPQHLEFYIDHDDYRLIPVLGVGVKREICDDFELVLEGDELVPIGYVKSLPCIQEEEEEEEGEGQIWDFHKDEGGDDVEIRKLVALHEQEEDKIKLVEKGDKIDEGQNREFYIEVGDDNERKMLALEEEEEEGEKWENEGQNRNLHEEEGDDEERELVALEEQEVEEKTFDEGEKGENEGQNREFHKEECDDEERKLVALQEQEVEEGEKRENEWQNREFLREEDDDERKLLALEEHEVEEKLFDECERGENEGLDREFQKEEGDDDERKLLALEEHEVVEKKFEEGTKGENEEQNREFDEDEGDDEERKLVALQEQEVEEKKFEEGLEFKQEEKIEEETHVDEIIPILEVEDKVIELNEMTSSPLEEDNETDLKNNETDAERNEDGEGDIRIQVDEPCKHETPTIVDNVVCEVSTSSSHLPLVDEHDGKHIEGDVVITEANLIVNVNLCHSNEVEEERIPDTPTSVESIHQLNKKLLLLGRRESVTEESLDGSIVSENESGDGVATIDKLKSDLQTERKTLRALYKELEEERNAAAIAANQTMAMITRLQEEKATMQMEALQYQRMMEEQSEYDQEALQMMNELMVKREKEKQELEKEIEVYRRKVIEYEEREKMRILSRRRDESLRSRNSSASCSYGGEESDGLSVDLNNEVKDHDEDTSLILHNNDENGHQDTPTDAVICLQDSLASFEEERRAILEQLKALEEKLFTLSEEEEDHIVNMKPFQQFYEENGKEFEDGSYKVSSDANGGGENGFSHINGKHQEETRINGSMQKRLLPLFDATELLETTDLNGTEDGFDSLELHKSPISKFGLEKKRLAIEEEVDNVYERLQALEADREFLKHCIGSIRKGDKGLDLLQEILQHLRDLKSVELQVMKNMDHSTSV